MSKTCEDIRPLLAEVAYGEAGADVAAAVREHLGSCLPCRRYRLAVDAVRNDLQAWRPPEETASRNITFIAPVAAPARPWSKRLVQGLAIAASFVFGAILMAAVVDLNIRADESGWTISAGLWNSAATTQQAAPAETLPVSTPPVPAQADLSATPRLVSLDDIDRGALEDWLEQQLSARGVAPVASPPAPERLTEAQWQQVTRGVNELLNESIVARDTQLEQVLRDVVAASESRQLDYFATTLSMVYQTMEAERQDELIELASQFGLLQVDTDRRIHQANSRIDNLVTQVSSPIARERQPEQ